VDSPEGGVPPVAVEALPLDEEGPEATEGNPEGGRPTTSGTEVETEVSRASKSSKVNADMVIQHDGSTVAKTAKTSVRRKRSKGRSHGVK